MVRTMPNENNLPKYFQAEAINTSSYVLNRVLLRPILNKTPYEFWKVRNLTLAISKSLDANDLY